MAKRKHSPAPDHDCVRVSASLARGTHTRLSALASLRGCTISALIVEAVEEAVRGIVVMDRRKSSESVDSAGLVKESVESAA
ncbi:hypothetical protein [Tautonia rosea]|uniref:hypothetical protein n=1 Tax=Tautonia rosea TaxID=2728037 RepID=UPI001473F6F1|nr:hypothetical protein [Tautonia rosea]